MNRCSFCEWIPILPWPIWPLAGQLLLGQNVVVGSMTLLLAVRGKHCHEKYVGTPVFFTTALHHGLVWSYQPILAGFLGSFALYQLPALAGRRDDRDLISLTRRIVNHQAEYFT